jgi:hypothetical protein
MFTVLWGLEAMEDLTRLWTQADSPLRKAITVATHQMDKKLANDPENTGESRIGNERIDFVFPLSFRFDVDQSNKTVRVLQVWRFQKRK